MKKYLISLNLIILLTLTLLIAFKLSEQAVAVIVGMGLGVLASIPGSLLLYFAITQKERQNTKMTQNSPYASPQSPVIIVSGGNQPAIAPPPTSFSPQPTSIPGGRTFTVVGDESMEL